MTSLPYLPFLAGAALIPFVGRRLGGIVMLAAPALAGLQLVLLADGDGMSAQVFGFELGLLRADRLSLAFGYVLTGAAFLGGVFGLRVMGRWERSAALLYAGSAVGAVLAGDLVTLVVFWELMAVSAAVLVFARQTPESAGSGMRYLQVHLAGGALLVGGVLWHYAETGSTAFEVLNGHASSLLILVAFALNAAIPPLHAWLTDAYPQGTVAGAVFLSAFTTKVSVYALARGFPGMEVLVWLGIAMALYGVVYAVLENDIRRLLAYHIISQVGFMVTAVGIGTPEAINGATAHAFAHILYKGLLFMGAGAVLYATGRSKLTELGGLARAMPLTLTLYMVGAFSISSVPLFSGFVAKELVINAAYLDGREVAVLLLKLASIGTFLHTGLKLPYFTWFGPRREVEVGPVPRSMIVGMTLAAAVNVFIGMVPGAFYSIMPFPVDYAPYTATHLSETIQLLTFTGLGFWLLLRQLSGEPTITLDTDWLYRRPARAARRVFVSAPAATAEALDRGLWEATRRLGELALEPPKRATDAVGRLLSGRTLPSAPSTPPTWILGLAIMLAVSLLLIVSLL